MILLTETTDTLQVLLGNSVASNQWVLYCSYADISTTTFTPSATNMLTNNTTPVTLVDSPLSGTQRQIKYISVYNADSASGTVTVRFNANGTTRVLCTTSLASGYKLEYTDGRGFQALSTTGGKAVSLQQTGSWTVTVQDGGGSLTVDGTVAATQSGTWVLGANSGIDIGDVTINNAAGASAVNIQDGGNSITVDGTVGVTQSTSPWIVGWNSAQPVSGTVTALQGTNPWVVGWSGAMGVSGTVTANQGGTWNIGTVTTITNVVHVDDNASTLSVDDGGSSITVDGSLTSTQGTSPWIVGWNSAQPVSGTVTALQGTNPWVIAWTGAREVSGTVSALQSGTWNIGTVTTITNVVHVDDNATTLSVDDGGGSLTVDGTVAATQSGSWSVTNLANSGVDIGDVTINNTSGAGAVNIQDGGNSITVDGTLTTTQGTSPWIVGWNSAQPVSGTVTALQGTNPWVIAWTGAREVSGTVSAVQSGTWNIGTVTTITNVVHVDDNSSTLSIDDGAGSITVDGTVAATQSGTWVLGANSGIDIGDVTINNAAGAAAVNIQDGGNSITVDGSITSTQGTSPWIVGWNSAQPVSGTVTVLQGVNPWVIAWTGAREVSGTVSATQSGTWNIGTVTTITNVVHVDDNSSTLSVDDGAGSITVDAPVATPVFVRLSDGASAISALPVTDNGTTLSIDDGAGSITVDGTVAATQSGTWVLGANSGIDIGDVTINNATGAGAVNIQDGGNSITVDGTVGVTQSTSPWIVGWNSAQPVSGTVTVMQGTIPWNVNWSGPMPVSGTVTVQGSLSAVTTVSTVSEARIAGQYDDLLTAVPVEDAYSTVRITGTRGLHVNLRNSSAVEIGTDSSPLKIYPTGVVVVSGAVTQGTSPWSTKEVTAATSIISSVSLTTNASAILLSNTNRLGATLFNGGAQTAYVKFGTSPSTVSYTLQIGFGQYYEVPFGYTGAIWGITSTGSTTMIATELTT